MRRLVLLALLVAGVAHADVGNGNIGGGGGGGSGGGVTLGDLSAYAALAGASFTGPVDISSGAALTSRVSCFASTTGDFCIFVTGADPSSVITASPGDLAVDVTGTAALYLKATGSGTNTGWVAVSTGMTGTNTGDVTLGTANGLSLVAQALSLAAAGSGQAGAVSTGAQTFDGAKTFSTPIADDSVSDTLTCSIVKGSGTTTDAVDLATAEVAGTLPIARGGTNSATGLSGSSIMDSDGTHIVQGPAGTSTTVLHGAAAGQPTYGAVSLTADVTGQLPDANVSDTLTCSIFKGSGTSTDAVDLATAEVAGTLAAGNGGTGSTAGALSLDGTAQTISADKDVTLTGAADGLNFVGGSVSIDSTSSLGLEVYSHSATASTAPTLDFLRSRGTRGSPALLTVAGPDRLAYLNFDGHDGSAYATGASEGATVAEDWAVGHHGTDLFWATTAIAASSGVEHMRLKSTGQLFINSNASAAPLLVQQNNVTRIQSDSNPVCGSGLYLSLGTGGTSGICDNAGAADGTRLTIRSNGSNILEASSTQLLASTSFQVATAKFLQTNSTNLTLTATTATEAITGSDLRLLVSGTNVTAWTPPTTNGVNGAIVTMCNVDASGDIITLTAGATLKTGHAGSTCVLDSLGCASMVYDSTDTVWRLTSCRP